MFAPARRLFRRYFPRRVHPLLDAPDPDEGLDSTYRGIYESQLSPDERADPFLHQRFDEGRRWRRVLSSSGADLRRVLDVGGGNGAIELAFESKGHFVVSIDMLWNESARQLQLRAGTPSRRVIGSADLLPFRDACFSQVVCLETIEHVQRPATVGQELSRVLVSGGAILLTTPCRLKYLFSPDPHFSIRGLLLLPPVLQRRVAAGKGFDQPHHFVNQIFQSLTQLDRLFPDCERWKVLNRSRWPSEFAWDAVVWKKTVPGSRNTSPPCDVLA